jgi:NAD(P)H-dependent FMN reductase
MELKVLGISGSPVINSNTDRVVKAVLEATGLSYEFVKLSDLNIRPCIACKKCVKDNVCKQEDDFSWLSKKVVDASALVIGAYTPYMQIDAFTKAFLERLWSLRHVNNLLKDKPVIIIVSRMYPKRLNNPALRITGVSKLISQFIPNSKVSKMLAFELKMDRMDILANIQINGNLPCLTCGRGNDCKMSGVKFVYGKNASASADKCVRVEDQKKTWNELQNLGSFWVKD